MSTYLFKNSLQFFFDVFAAESPGKDSAVRTKKDDMGDATDIVGIGGYILCIDNLGIWHAIILNGAQ